MRAWPSAGMVLAMLFLGCGSEGLPTDGSSGVHDATLASSQGPPMIDAPDAVKIGDAVAVSFPTLSSGCEEDVGTVVATTERAVTITPLERSLLTVGRPCPAIVGFATRSVSVFFAAPGVDTLRVVGYLAMPDGSLQLGSLQKTVVVAP